MPPILDGTADTNSWQQPTGLLALALSIPVPVRIAVELVIGGLLIWGVA